MEACLAGKAAWLGACAAMSCFGEMSFSIRPAAKSWHEKREAALFPRRKPIRCISTVDRR
ncbi:hypothetical protein, partial [Mesorhizobium sp. M2E.F.Ca.ET.154.01.1.1]|uniref:hypothetical protein n=1 Tax=Mesorhizobium sp. M2E.F.Ca.ET.154.01.1.1 TaxID=2500521 RepID=UPI001AEE0FFF